MSFIVVGECMMIWFDRSWWKREGSLTGRCLGSAGVLYLGSLGGFPRPRSRGYVPSSLYGSAI